MAKSSPSPARTRPTVCRECGTVEGFISMRALCAPCAVDRMTFAATELHHREGPAYDAWVAGMERAVARAQAGTIR